MKSYALALVPLAIGLLCGLIPGPLQVAFTLVLCSLLRANVVIGVVFLRERLTALRAGALVAALVGTALTIGGGVGGSWQGVALGVARAPRARTLILPRPAEGSAWVGLRGTGRHRHERGG